MKKQEILSAGLLLLAAMIWGVAFVAQDAAAGLIEPFTLNAVRSFIAAAALVPVAGVTRGMRGLPLLERDNKGRRDLMLAGGCCGALLAVAVNFQQFGIAMYPDGAAAAGRAGFLTALYIVFVPLIGLFFGRKPSVSVFVAVGIATVGLYLLCLSGGIGALYLGDVVVLCCAVAFAMQILCVDRFIDRVDGVKLSSVMFLVCGTLSAILMVLFEHPSLSALIASWRPILYLALLSSAGGYTLQIIGQKYARSPAVASILMSMESVFAVLGGVVLAGERMLPREVLGCAVMLVAIIIAQLPSKPLHSHPQ